MSVYSDNTILISEIRYASQNDKQHLLTQDCSNDNRHLDQSDPRIAAKSS